MSKDDLYAKKKNIASSTLRAIMIKYYNRKMLQYLSRYRDQVFKIRIIESKRRAILAHWSTKDLRCAFNKWKHHGMQKYTF